MTKSIASNNTSPLYKWKWWSLEFDNFETEKKYRATHAINIQFIRNITSLLAICIYGGFGFLDYLVSEDYYELWLYRLIIGIPALAGVALLGYLNCYSAYERFTYSVATLMVGCSLIVMIATQDKYVAALYYAGIIIVLFYCCMLFFICFTHTAIICFSYLGLYAIAALIINPIEIRTFYSNIFFLTAAVVLCSIAAYLLEYSSRQNFKLSQLLLEKARIAESANKAKSDFLSVMSHELRSPLISVKGYAEMMEHEMMGPLSEKYRTYASDIRTSAEHLVSIIGDVLDYTKITGGHWELKSEPILSTALLHESITLIKGMAEQKKIGLHSDIKEEVLLTLDTRLTRQMITNLISNALKFSDAGTAITIRLERDDHGGACIAVIDQGKGIPEGDLERVLKPFEQTHDPKSRESSGTGLGLPFVVEVMQRHGGSIKLESTVGIGTTVMLHFPPERVRTA